MPNIWVFLVVILSSLVKGITGFGFALVSFPLLLIWYTPMSMGSFQTTNIVLTLLASILLIIR